MLRMQYYRHWMHRQRGRLYLLNSQQGQHTPVSQHCCSFEGRKAHIDPWCVYAAQKVRSFCFRGSTLLVLTCHKDTHLGSVTAALLDSLLESGTDGLLEGSAPADIEA